VLLIKENYELSRVLVALLVSVLFLALDLAFKPHRRKEDGALMVLIELIMVLIYTCVLLIKTCHLSPYVCENYGFGDASGANMSQTPHDGCMSSKHT
jgi:hypothetical protein